MTTPPKDPVFQRIELMLLQKRWTYSELANRMGESRQNLYNWKARRFPSDHYSKAAKALDINLEWLIRGEGAISKKHFALGQKIKTIREAMGWDIEHAVEEYCQEFDKYFGPFDRSGDNSLGEYDPESERDFVYDLSVSPPEEKERLKHTCTPCSFHTSIEAWKGLENGQDIGMIDTPPLVAEALGVSEEFLMSPTSHLEDIDLSLIHI